MTRNHALILIVALGGAVTAPPWAQTQNDWQAPDIDELADDAFGKSVRHGKALTHTSALRADEQAFDVAAHVNSQPRPPP